MLFNFHTHNAQHSNEIQNYFPADTPTTTLFSVGIHPWYISENWEKDFYNVQKMSVLQNCVAIGECGLDKLVKTDISLQKHIFQAHISLSEELKKPLIIHCVRSFSEIISIKKKVKPQQCWVLHGFQKNEQVAYSLLENNIKLSFGAAVLTDERQQNLIKKLSLNDFFLETDNVNIPIEEIYKKVAKIKEIEEEKLSFLLKKSFLTNN